VRKRAEIRIQGIQAYVRLIRHKIVQTIRARRILSLQSRATLSQLILNPQSRATHNKPSQLALHNLLLLLQPSQQILNQLDLVAEKEVAQPFQILAVAGDQIKK
jgi:hypothetical protein